MAPRVIAELLVLPELPADLDLLGQPVPPALLAKGVKAVFPAVALRAHEAPPANEV